MADYELPDVENVIEMMTLLNTYTDGLGWNVIVLVAGFILFIGLKSRDTENSLMITGFICALFSALMNFAGLVNVYTVSISFAVLVLSMLAKFFQG